MSHWGGAIVFRFREQDMPCGRRSNCLRPQVRGHRIAFVRCDRTFGTKCALERADERLCLVGSGAPHRSHSARISRAIGTYATRIRVWDLVLGMKWWTQVCRIANFSVGGLDITIPAWLPSNDCTQHRLLISDGLLLDKMFCASVSPSQFYPYPPVMVRAALTLKHSSDRHNGNENLDTLGLPVWKAAAYEGSSRVSVQFDPLHADAAHIPSEFPESRCFCQASTNALLPLETSSIIGASASVWVR